MSPPPPSPKSLKFTDPQEWAEAYALHLVENVINHIDKTVKPHEVELARQVIAGVVQYVIGTAVLMSLSSKEPHSDPKVAFKAASRSFGTMKAMLQEAVGQGFTTGMSTFSGKSCEYICQVSLVPESSNTKRAH